MCNTKDNKNGFLICFSTRVSEQMNGSILMVQITVHYTGNIFKTCVSHFVVQIISTGVQLLDFCCSSLSELVCCGGLVLFHLSDES